MMRTSLALLRLTPLWHWSSVNAYCRILANLRWHRAVYPGSTCHALFQAILYAVHARRLERSRLTLSVRLRPSEARRLQIPWEK